MSKSVFIIDDCQINTMLLESVFEDLGYDVVGKAKYGADGLQGVLEFKPEYVTLDNVLPDMTGTEILKKLKSVGIKSKIIVISSVLDEQVIAEQKQLGIHSYIKKPFTEIEIKNILTSDS